MLIFNKLIAENNNECLKWFAEAVTTSNHRARLHIVSIEGGLAFVEDILQRYDSKTVLAYTANIKEDCDVKAVWESCWHCCLVIDKEGQLVGINQMHSVEQIQEVIEYPQLYDTGISEELAELLTNLPTSEVFKEVQIRLKALPYYAFVRIEYQEEHADDKGSWLITRPPVLKMCIH